MNFLARWWDIQMLTDFLAGLPKQDESYAYYNEQEYKDDYDYGDEDIPSVEVEGAATVLTHRPVIISEPINTDVDNGMTIRLPCIVDKLPGKECDFIHAM